LETGTSLYPRHLEFPKKGFIQEWASSDLWIMD